MSKTVVVWSCGHANKEWSYGIVVKRMVENGDYDMEWVSLKQLESAYG